MSRLQHSSTSDWLEVTGNQSAQTHRQDEAERSCVEIVDHVISQNLVRTLVQFSLV